MYEQILMKLYAIVVYNLEMWMKEDAPGPRNIKGDNSMKIINCA